VSLRVKVCGITHAEDAWLCAEGGVDALGFVVEYPSPVPWNQTRSEAAELMRAAPRGPAHVAVVGGRAEELLRIADETRPDELQLHGDEPEDVVAALASALAGSGIRIVKALRMGAHETRSKDEWLELGRRFLDAGADVLLFDSKTAERPAGTGLTFDWAIARAAVAAGVGPVIVAGGLTVANVASAVGEVSPWGVDVLSSVEDERNRKVPELVEAFVRAARAAAA
jgi:phosphoribosylanthranilate isomerase